MSIHDPDPDHPEDSDGFSARLRSQPLAALPKHWRADILATARRAVPPPAVREPHQFGWLAAWMWPHPCAYPALALVWLVILTLRWSIPIRETPAPRQITNEVAPTDDSLGLGRTQLAINTVLFASSRHQEARQ